MRIFITWIIASRALVCPFTKTAKDKENKKNFLVNFVYLVVNNLRYYYERLALLGLMVLRKSWRDGLSRNPDNQWKI